MRSLVVTSAIIGLLLPARILACAEGGPSLTDARGRCLVEGVQMSCDDPCAGVESDGRSLQIVGYMKYPVEKVLKCKAGKGEPVSFKLKSGRTVQGKLKGNRYLLEVVEKDGTRQAIDWGP